MRGFDHPAGYAITHTSKGDGEIQPSILTQRIGKARTDREGYEVIIGPDIYTGNPESAIAEYTHLLEDHRVQIILDCRIEWNDIDFFEDHFGQRAKYVHMPLDDDGKLWSLKTIKKLRKTFDHLMTTHEGPVYVHCHMGVNRGPSVALFLLEWLTWSELYLYGDWHDVETWREEYEPARDRFIDKAIELLKGRPEAAAIYWRPTDLFVPTPREGSIDPQDHHLIPEIRYADSPRFWELMDLMDQRRETLTSQIRRKRAQGY